MTTQDAARIVWLRNCRFPLIEISGAGDPRHRGVDFAAVLQGLCHRARIDTGNRNIRQMEVI